MKKSNDLICKTFEDYELHTMIWNGRPCWIGKEIVKGLDYSNGSAVLNECIERMGFEPDIEYKILEGEELSKFRNIANSIIPSVISVKARKLIILFEPGLYGVLQYSTRPAGLKFSRWVRREVVPELRKKGYYILGEKSFKNKVKVKTIVVKENNCKEESKDESFYNEMKIALRTLEIWEMANKEGGIFLDGTIQILNKFGLNIK
ncbi:BRO family protein [uncultured Clostridium sp.]|jgi:prophage antirepressor-like protein|uniref:BRO-N domain-containing protein n=1 Tax=uncultured Clostridium sp. TaxID=59620 RepID=UPI002615A873|nr:BRO family protein [uncultured Clostridium sp.]